MRTRPSLDFLANVEGNQCRWVLTFAVIGAAAGVMFSVLKTVLRQLREVWSGART